MRTLTVSEITTAHAAIVARKGAGFAPSLADTLAAAKAGRLFDVDTRSAGDDCWVDATDADAALAEVAEFSEPDLCAAHDGGTAGWVASRRWTATQIVLAQES